MRMVYISCIGGLQSKETKRRRFQILIHNQFRTIVQGVMKLSDIRKRKTELLDQIEMGKKLMIQLTNLYGLDDNRVVAYSKKLDRLIVEYQEIKIEELKNSQRKSL